MTIRKLVISSVIFMVPIYSWAHGYISSPESRVYSCSLNHNSNCGPAQYEPQSMEGPSGFPASGPADGSIASAGHSSYSAVDEQTASRWLKQPMTAGAHNFVWTHTAAHRTKNWRYYITKQDWSPNQPLSRAAFEATPFCQYEGNGNPPEPTVTHSCNVPSRTGYQVILGVWEIFDTTNSFYQVVDVDFGGGSSITDQWPNQIGQIKPEQDLNTGDKVSARLFNNTSELTSQKITWTITSETEGKANNWSYALAKQINTSNSSLRAGVKDGTGNIAPTYGNNAIFTSANSGLTRVEIEVQPQAPVEVNSFTLNNVVPNYNAAQKSLNLGYNVVVTGSLDLTMTVFGPDNAQKAQLTAAGVSNKTSSWTISMQNINPGTYTLVVVGKDAAGKVTQQSYPFTLKDASGTATYDFVFPEGLSSYVAGTRVLQPKDNKVYQCRPAPYSNWCKQWTSTNFGYEPGYGFAWQQAWTLAK
jgi:predicted carbohydrate-binding protein with CBM5 and CBM33 domain